jgi:hypothetical protein
VMRDQERFLYPEESLFTDSQHNVTHTPTNARHI